MKLQISCSSLSVPAIIPRHYNRLIPINPTIKNTKSYNFSSKCSTNKSILPVQLYGERGFSKFLIHGKDKRNSIRGCAQDEFADSHPVLAEVKDKSDGRHILAKVLRFGSAWFSFTRPISMYQLGLAAICLYGRGFVENPHLFKWSLLVKAFPGLIAVLLANANFMGINQIYDADIDRVNKPDLPIPSGELSIRQAWFLAVFEALAGLLILRLMNANLITTALYCFGLFLGAAYSVPPIRFKRHSATTSVGLGMVSAIKHIGILYASRVSLGLPFLWSPPNVVIITFIVSFFLVFTLTKDIPDVEGDMKHNIRTFAAIFGPKNIALLGTGMLFVNYMVPIVAAIYMPHAFKRHVILPAHSILILLLFSQFKKLEKANYTKEASTTFHTFLWKLLIFEFLLIPFI